MLKSYPPGWSTLYQIQDRAPSANPKGPDQSERWDGHYWHLVVWHKSGRARIYRDTSRVLKRRAGDFSIYETATTREYLQPMLERMKG